MEDSKITITNIAVEKSSISSSGSGNIILFDTKKGKFSSNSGLVPQEVSNSIKKMGCLIPPINRSLPVVLEKADPTHRSALDVKAITTTQKGYEVLNPSKKVKRFIKKPSVDSFTSLQDILDAFAYEYYVYDEAYLEIIRIADRISMYIAPAQFIYIKTNDLGRVIKYCYITNQGNVTELEPYTGGELKNGVRYIVGMKNYNTTSMYYGLPAYFSAIEAMLENSFIRRYGIKFFENDASPSKALIITGTTMSQENKVALTNYLSTNFKGVDNSHRIMVLTLDDEGASAKFEDMSKNMDGSYLDEYKKNRDEIVTIHQIPPKLLGIHTASGLSSGSETIGSLRDFIDRTMTPKQEKFSVFFSTLFSEMFQSEIEFKFKKIDTTNEKDEAIVNKIYASIQDEKGKPVKTVTEIREEIGMPETPNGDFNSKPNTDNSEKPGAHKDTAQVPGMSTYQNPNDIDGVRPNA